jgi:hypothetical protein
MQFILSIKFWEKYIKIQNGKIFYYVIYEKNHQFFSWPPPHDEEKESEIFFAYFY